MGYVHRGREPGGIAWLAALLLEQRPAVEYTLIKYGLRLRDLGDEHLNVHDVVVLCMVEQHMPGTALAAAVRGEDSSWGLPEHLLATIADAVHNLVWMQSKDGQKGANRPKPIPRPGARPEVEKTTGTRMTVEEAAEWLGWDKT